MIHRNSGIELSVLIPVGKRRAEVRALHAEYRDGVERTGLSYEFVYVLDGEYPEFKAGLDALQAAGEKISIVCLSRTFGESTALMAGIERTVGEIILTMPAYYQIPGSEIPKLLAALSAADIVVCQRKPRVGGFLERARRNAFHGLVSWMTGLQLHDLGCSARAMKRRVLEEIALYGDQHRLLPALADRQGFRVLEIDALQSPQDHFEGGYRTREYAHRFLDVFAVFFLVRFTKKPLRFFGMIGATTLCVGTALVIYLVIARLFFDQALADRPALLLSSLLVVLGLQLFALGLLGELIIFTHARDLKDYQVDRVIEFTSDAGVGEHQDYETGRVIEFTGELKRP
jgi:glycosyltransferase involved in cell wall biosynthesis